MNFWFFENQIFSFRTRLPLSLPPKRRAALTNTLVPHLLHLPLASGCTELPVVNWLGSSKMKAAVVFHGDESNRTQQPSLPTNYIDIDPSLGFSKNISSICGILTYTYSFTPLCILFLVSSFTSLFLFFSPFIVIVSTLSMPKN